MPALFIGLLEDVTKRVSVRTRLLVTMGSGGLAGLHRPAWASTRVDIPPADLLLSIWPVAVLFTAFAVGGVANAINIIDGFHGLASGTVIISALGLAAIAHSRRRRARWRVAALVAGRGGGRLLAGQFPLGQAVPRATAAPISPASRSPGCRWNCWRATRRSRPGPACCCAATPPWRWCTASSAAASSGSRPAKPTATTCTAWWPRSSSSRGCAHLHPNLRNAAVSVVMWVLRARAGDAGGAVPDTPDILLLAALGGCVARLPPGLSLGGGDRRSTAAASGRCAPERRRLARALDGEFLEVAALLQGLRHPLRLAAAAARPGLAIGAAVLRPRAFAALARAASARPGPRANPRSAAVNP